MSRRTVDQKRCWQMLYVGRPRGNFCTSKSVDTQAVRCYLPPKSARSSHSQSNRSPNYSFSGYGAKQCTDPPRRKNFKTTPKHLSVKVDEEEEEGVCLLQQRLLARLTLPLTDGFVANGVGSFITGREMKRPSHSISAPLARVIKINFAWMSGWWFNVVCRSGSGWLSAAGQCIAGSDCCSTPPTVRGGENGKITS